MPPPAQLATQAHLKYPSQPALRRFLLVPQAHGHPLHQPPAICNQAQFFLDHPARPISLRAFLTALCLALPRLPLLSQAPHRRLQASLCLALLRWLQARMLLLPVRRTGQVLAALHRLWVFRLQRVLQVLQEDIKALPCQSASQAALRPAQSDIHLRVL